MTILLIIAILPFLLIFLYPLQSIWSSFFKPNVVHKDLNFRPPISIIVVCFNEEKYIQERINLLLAECENFLHYEIIVISGGSTDSTNELLKNFIDHPSIKIYFEEKISKIESLNKYVPTCIHEYIVFSDCRQYIESGSIGHLIANLKDPSVGTVNCTLMDVNQKPSFFRKFFANIGIIDSIHGSTFNLYGALYAQRREVFRPIPANLLFDDLFVAVSTLSQNKRLIQESSAIIYDVPFNNYYTNERIQRLVRGLLLFWVNNQQLIKSLPFWMRMRFIHYKYLKIFIPFFLSFLLITVISQMLVSKYWFEILSALLGVFICILIFKKTRNFCGLLVRINYFFAKSFLTFVLFNGRSNKWDKLKPIREKMNTG